MDFDEEKTQNFIKVKNKLSEGEIKLWLSPYVGSNGKKNSDELQKLADSFSEQLTIPNGQCLLLLEKLQTKARKNVKDHDRYLSTGEAALKIKVFYEVGETLLTIPIDLSSTGNDLKWKICKQASIIPHRLRMIFRGKLIHEESILQEENIKHGLHIMGIALKPSCEALNAMHESYGRGVQAVSDIVILSRKGYFPSQENFKRISELPIRGRKFLIGGLCLHKIGRACMKKGDYSSAVAMLIEAEENFSNFDPSDLEIFSNCIVLNLDIVWCYMNLQCLVLLPDAGERLDQFEQDFKKMYGANLERTTPGTDFAWTALILLMRLHLLQAAVLYHRGRTFKAGTLLKRAERELRSLKVNSRHLSHLIQLGYRRTESRFALRETKGDITKAISKMEKKRAEMTNKLFELVKKGQYLLKSDLPEKVSGSARREAALYKSLLSMGCSEEVCKWVLEQRKSAVPEDDDEEEEKSVNSGDQNSTNGAICLKTIITIGFQPKRAKAALKKHGGDFDAAVKELFQKEFMLGYESYIEIDAARMDDPSENSGVSASSNVHDPTRAFSFEFREPMVCAQVFPERTDNVQYDYIDTTLSLEVSFLQKYKALLKKIKEERNNE